MSERYSIKVYIAGRTATARRALANLEKLREQLPGDQTMDIQVVDVLEHPEVAEREKVLATPMVVRESPDPIRRVIGDLSELEEAIVGLDLAV